MPSERKQLNIRLDEEMERLLAELVPQANEVTGLKVSQSDVIRLALRALSREYAAKQPPEPKRKK